jgi:hypothetical protein
MGGAGGSGGSTSSSGGAGGGPPPATDLYVDSAMGNDNNDGSKATPLRTLGKAAALIKATHTIFLAAGNYNDATGETFTHAIPADTRISGAGSASTILTGKGQETALSLLGAANVTGLTLSNFGTSIRATKGNVAFSDIVVKPASSAIAADISGTANASFVTCSFRGGSSAMRITKMARASMTGGEVTGIGPACGGGVTAFTLADTAGLTLDGTNVHDLVGSGIELRGNSSATLQNQTILQNFTFGQCSADAITVIDTGTLLIKDSTIQSMTGDAIILYAGGAKATLDHATVVNTNRGIEMQAGTTLDWTGGTMDGGALGQQGLSVRGGTANVTQAVIKGVSGIAIYVDSGGKLTMSSTQLSNNYQGISLAGDANGNCMPGSIDLGKPGAMGFNTLQNTSYGLYISCSNSVTFNATGNFWWPNDSGADANGQYAPGMNCGPIGNAGSPRNLRIVGAGPCVQY